LSRSRITSNGVRPKRIMGRRGLDVFEKNTGQLAPELHTRGSQLFVKRRGGKERRERALMLNWEEREGSRYLQVWRTRGGGIERGGTIETGRKGEKKGDKEDPIIAQFEEKEKKQRDESKRNAKKRNCDCSIAKKEKGEGR